MQLYPKKDLTLCRIMELNEALSMMRAYLCNKRKLMVGMKLREQVKMQAEQSNLLHDMKTVFLWIRKA